MTYVCDYFAYKGSVELVRQDPSFYALLMAAMRKADTFNEGRLRATFPDVWDELQARYNAPGGVLANDSNGVKEKILGPGWRDVELPRLPG